MPHAGGRDNHEKRQKETHSEIERKRRERMKRETEFLQQQLSNYECRDKISVLQAGTQELNNYVQNLGERDYLITPQELTSLILNNFPGFYIHLECKRQRIISISERVISVLGFQRSHFMNTALESVIKSDELVSQNIAEFLYLTDQEISTLRNRETIKRTIILPILINPDFKGIQNKEHIVRCEGNMPFKFIEICGDVVLESPESYSEDNPVIVNDSGEIYVLKALCKSLEPPESSKLSQDKPRFSCKHEVQNFTVIEISGNSQDILGIGKREILRKQVQFMSSDQNLVNSMFNKALDTQKRVDSFYSSVYNAKIDKKIRLCITLKPIIISDKIYCIIGEYSCEETLSELNKSSLKDQNAKTESVLFYSLSTDEEEKEQEELKKLSDLFINTQIGNDAKPESSDYSKSCEIALVKPKIITTRVVKTDPNLKSPMIISKIYSSSSDSCSNLSPIRTREFKKDGEESSEASWPDNRSFSGLVATDKSIFDDLFDPTTLKDLVEEDITDIK